MGFNVKYVFMLLHYKIRLLVQKCVISPSYYKVHYQQISFYKIKGCSSIVYTYILFINITYVII